MADPRDRTEDLERRVEELGREVIALRERVSRLEGGALATRIPSAASGPQAAPGPAAAVPAPMGGFTAALGRFSAVSLVLVLALVLRTLTGRGLLGQGTGVALGLLYAASLVAAGWRMYGRRHAYAPILTACGAALFFSVVLEGAARFRVLAPVPSYALLGGASVVLAVLAHRGRSALPAAAAVVGPLLAGLPIGFPSPRFAALAALLLLVNAVAFTAAALPRSLWLRSVSALATASTLALWAFKLQAAAKTGAHPAPATAIAAWLAATSALLTLAAFARFLGRGPGTATLLDHALPSLASTGAYFLHRLAYGTGWRTSLPLGWAAAAGALALFGLALALARRGGGGKGASSFAFPSALLLALAFRDLSGESVAALAALALVAWGLLPLSRSWESGGVRITSYVLAATVSGALFLLLLARPGGAAPLLTTACSAAAAGVLLLHYGAARATAPPAASPWFSRVDRSDLGRRIVLFSGLLAAFLFLRAATHWALAAGPVGAEAFGCAQSVILNLGAAALFLLAHLRRDTELRGAAVAVTVAGGLKVFLLDLFRSSDVPLVLSVLSFGLAAAWGSLVLGRWHRRAIPAGGPASPGGRGDAPGPAA